MTIGVYNCATTVGAFSYWFLFDPTGPQMSRYQLTSLVSRTSTSRTRGCGTPLT